MQTCVNRWKVLHTVDLGESVVALQWLHANRRWIVPARQLGEAPESCDEEVPEFTRMHIMGPRAPTTNVAFIVVTASGHIRALYVDATGKLSQFGRSLEPTASNAVDTAEGEFSRAPYRLSQVDLRLLADSRILVAATQNDPFQSIVTWKLKVDFFRRVKDDLMVVATNKYGELPSETGKSVPINREASSIVAILKLCQSTETSVDYKWETTATFESALGQVTAVDVLTRSERRDCDPDPVILIGYHSGRCELREINGLVAANLNQFTFSPYVPSSSGSSSTSVAEEEPLDEKYVTNVAESVQKAGQDHASDMQRNANSAFRETDFSLQMQSPSMNELDTKTEKAADGLPILSFAVSPNCVEILVAKKGVDGSTVIDLFKYDCDTLEGRDAIVKCMAIKFALAIMNGFEYTDLSFSSAQLTISILRTVYKYYDVMCAVTDVAVATQTALPSAITSSTTVTPLNAPVATPPRRWSDSPLLSLQLAMHQCMPPRHRQPLVFITEAAIQITSVAGQCLASFEHHHVAMARIEALVHSGNFQVLEANGLNSAMIIRKDCLQHLALLQTWFIRFVATVMRQVYCAFSVHRNTGRRRTAAEDDSNAAGGVEEERVRALAEIPSALSLLFHKPLRDSMIIIALVMITLTQNLHIRAKFAKTGGNELLYAYYAQLLDSNRGAPLQFQPLARFLFELGRELEAVDAEHGYNNSVPAADVSEDGKPVSLAAAAPSRAAREREMLLTGRVAAGGGSEWGSKAVTRAKAIFEGHIRHVFEIRGGLTGPGAAAAPLPQPLSAAGPDDLLDLRLAPAIRLLFGFASVEAVGLTAPLQFGTGRPEIDIVSKRPLETLAVPDTRRRVRKCTRCGHSSCITFTARKEDADGNAEPAGRSDPLADYKVIERGAEAWAERMFRGNCVCGGWWKEIEDTTAPP
ncbi:hypothetical protein HDU86_000161 [Geranomyces michiganensis]|nr:hypothetical protein HDU86_000161 [Geranomyces michiganensis]